MHGEIPSPLIFDCQLSKENEWINNERVKSGKNDGDDWKIVNEVVNPNKHNNNWSLKMDNGAFIPDKKEIANVSAKAAIKAYTLTLPL